MGPISGRWRARVLWMISLPQSNGGENAANPASVLVKAETANDKQESRLSAEACSVGNVDLVCCLCQFHDSLYGNCLLRVRMRLGHSSESHTIGLRPPPKAPVVDIDHLTGNLRPRELCLRKPPAVQAHTPLLCLGKRQERFKPLSDPLHLRSNLDSRTSLNAFGDVAFCCHDDWQTVGPCLQDGHWQAFTVGRQNERVRGTQYGVLAWTIQRTEE